MNLTIATTRSRRNRRRPALHFGVSAFRRFGVSLRGRGRGFTLTELLVAMGVIAILATLTIISVRGISKDARLASATNAVVAALGEARAIAIRDNALVLVAFRARWDHENPKERQYTEIVIAKWTGESIRWSFDPANPNYDALTDRFVQVPGVATRPLPLGIKVAGPWTDYSVTIDDPSLERVWITQPEFRAMLGSGEHPGRMFGVMFAPDGTVVTRNPNSSGANHTSFVDFDNGGSQEVEHPTVPFSPDTDDFFEYDHPLDEIDVNPVQFLAVYDDEEAREFGNPATWTTEPQYIAELTGPEGYISQYANRIHFNRYTGVAMK